jgi:hypothetical protein
MKALLRLATIKNYNVFAFGVAGLLSLASAGAQANPEGFNSRWIAKDGEAVRILVHDDAGTCETLKDAKLVLITKGVKPGIDLGPVAATDLRFCILFVGADQSHNCTGGTVQATYDKARNAYVGKYELTFKDGTNQAGEIRAQQCAAPAAKK